MGAVMRKEALYTVNLCKSVNRQQVLRHLSFGLYEGEILGILGKNNLGIAALVRLLSGETVPDSGSLYVQGSQDALKDISSARKRGIYLISGESSLIPGFTVAENVGVSRPFSLRGFFISHRRNEKKIDTFLKEYGFELSPYSVVEQLSAFERYQTELARALYGGARILVFYQAGVGLSDEELEAMKRQIRDLQKRGISILYINAPLNYMMSFTDRIVVLSSGTVAGVVEKRDYDSKKIQKILFGKDITQPERILENAGRELVLSLRQSVPPDGTAPVVLNIYRGEVTGIFSDSATGRSLFDLLMGRRRLDGEVRIGGKTVPGRLWKHVERYGIGSLERDSCRTALFPNLSVRENLMLRSYKFHARMGILNWRLLSFMSGELGEIYQIPMEETIEGLQNIESLRNAAFPLIAWIAARPEVLVLHGILETADEVEMQHLANLFQVCRKKGIAVVCCMDRAEGFEHLFDTVHNYIGGMCDGH